jgi:hypothetical protein
VELVGPRNRSRTELCRGSPSDPPTSRRNPPGKV